MSATAANAPEIDLCGGHKRSLKITCGSLVAFRWHFCGISVDTILSPEPVAVPPTMKRSPIVAPNNHFRSSSFERDSLPLDSVETAFELLITGPDPLAIDGRFFPGLPARRVPLDELREHLLDDDAPDLPMSAVDLIWRHLVTRSRDEGGAWTVACVGMALPALFAVTLKWRAANAEDKHDLHAAVLTGFLAELSTVDLTEPWVLWRLLWGAKRGGHLFFREVLDRPLPMEEDFHSSEPNPPSGHPDFVLARAVAEGAITRAEAELIGSTRLEDYPLTAAAADIGVSVTTLGDARDAAEARLVEWLTDQAPHEDRSHPQDSEVERHAIHAATVTEAAVGPATGPGSALRQPRGKSRTVTTAAEKLSVTVRYRTRKNGPDFGVGGCGRKAAAPAHATPPEDSGATPEEPRCA
jgi:hypothetical protein